VRRKLDRKELRRAGATRNPARATDAGGGGANAAHFAKNELARRLLRANSVLSTTATPRILVADDSADVLEALRWLLAGEGYDARFVDSAEGVIDRLREEKFDLLLMDLNYSRDTTSGREGLELIPRVRAQDPLIPIVVMTGWGSIDTAVDAMRRGASSFVQKPWDDAAL